MKIVRILLVFFLTPSFAFAEGTCIGKFINPITDVCWSCVLPITLASVTMGKTSKVKNRDTKNPASPFCACSKAGLPAPVPGITVGFWEPIRLIDVTRTPYCMVGLGGIKLASDDRKITAYRSDEIISSSFYHLHYYMYPLIYWLELITDFACLEAGSFDVAYLSEFDISWNNPSYQNLLNPETILFANTLAQEACALDCTASMIDLPRDEMFWCAGCLGSIYPFSGYNGSHQGGVQSSSLIAIRILAKLHRVGLAHDTSTDDAAVNGRICQKKIALKIKKSQYKLQMVYPKSNSGDQACTPLGYPPLLHGAFKEYPGTGQDWVYLLWRKKNCCLF